MRLWIVVAVLLLGGVPTVAGSYALERILYQKGPWAVFRASSDGGPVCEARVEKPDGMLRFIAAVRGSTFLVSITRSGWKFQPRRADATLAFGQSSLVISGADYEGQSVWGSLEVSYLDFFADFMTDSTASVIIRDENGRKIGTFPVKGIVTAMKQWRACIKR